LIVVPVSFQTVYRLKDFCATALPPFFCDRVFRLSEAIEIWEFFLLPPAVFLDVSFFVNISFFDGVAYTSGGTI